MMGANEHTTFQQERMTGVRRTQDIPIEPHDRNRTNTAPAREPHRSAEQPPRAQSLQPELQPAKRNAAPARNSPSHEAKQRLFASARNIAP